MSGFFKRTRNLIFLATALIGLQEIAVLLIVFTPTVGLSGNAADFAVYITFVLFFGAIFLPTFELNLRGKTPNPLLAWLYLHTLYWLPSALNGAVLYGAVIYILTRNAFLTNWPILVALMVIITWFYDYLLLQGIGQGYQNFRGASWAGAAAFAKLAHGMFERKERGGLSPLMKGLQMAQTLFNLQGYVPEDLDAVHSTVVALSETPSISFRSLVDLTATLETLPRLDDLPLALSKFLRDTKWPGMFKHVHRRRASTSQRLVILLAALTALSTFLTALPNENRSSFFGGVGSFVVANLLTILSIGGIVIASIAILYTVIYWVPLGYVRKFWPRGDNSEFLDQQDMENSDP